jgi:hypothetical protein
MASTEQRGLVAAVVAIDFTYLLAKYGRTVVSNS